MFDIKDVKLNGLEKAMQLRWAMVLIASLAFADAYLLVRFHVSVLDVDAAWIKANVDVGEGLFLVCAFSLAFGVIIPGAGAIGRLLLGTIVDAVILKLSGRLDVGQFTRPEVDKAHYVHKDQLRRWAINTSNSAAYREYEQFEADRNDLQFIQYMAQSFLVLSCIAFLFSSSEHPSLMESMQAGIASLPWYQDFPLRAVWAGVLFFVFGVAFRDEGQYRDQVYLYGHSIPDDSRAP